MGSGKNESLEPAAVSLHGFLLTRHETRVPRRALGSPSSAGLARFQEGFWGVLVEPQDKGGLLALFICNLEEGALNKITSFYFGMLPTQSQRSALVCGLLRSGVELISQIMFADGPLLTKPVEQPFHPMAKSVIAYRDSERCIRPSVGSGLSSKRREDPKKQLMNTTSWHLCVCVVRL